MLGNELARALEELDRLIALTKEDIEDVKMARHERFFARHAQKEGAVAAFEKSKARIDKIISDMAAKAPQKELDAVLDASHKEALSRLRRGLETLKEQNRRLARLVVTVGEFYDSLYEAILPVEKEGYGPNKRKVPSLMEVRV